MTELRKAAIELLKSAPDHITEHWPELDEVCKALSQPEQEPVTKSGLYSTAGRLALELECLLLDTKDISIVSKWWDSAHEALDQWREFHLRACTELDSAEITKSCDSKPESDAMRLYQSVARLAMQADGDVGETIDWLCGEHGGMFKLFESYFSPKPLANQTVASGSPIDSPTNIAVLSINSSDSATRSADSAETFGKTEQEAIYQLRCDGMWIDRSKENYEYNLGLGNTVRIVYATPPSKPEQGCAECGVKASDGYALYCVACTDLFTQPEQEPVAWKPVVGYEEFYEVSSVGDLRDTKTKKIKSKSLMGAGYVKADLWANGARKQTSMHRLVAEAFLIPTGNANEVNHKNGIKTDNRVENLEWLTRSDNVNHSYYELNNQVKPISATHIETGNTLYYPSVEAAVRDGFCSAHISSVIAGRRKHHKGFVFKEAAPPSKQDTRLKVKLGRQYGGDLNGHWFYLQPADEYAEQALTKHSGISAPPSKPCAITDMVQQKFQSGNNVPVERITITRSEYEAALRSKNNG